MPSMLAHRKACQVLLPSPKVIYKSSGSSSVPDIQKSLFKPFFGFVVFRTLQQTRKPFCAFGWKAGGCAAYASMLRDVSVPAQLQHSKSREGK